MVQKRKNIHKALIKRVFRGECNLKSTLLPRKSAKSPRKSGESGSEPHFFRGFRRLGRVEAHILHGPYYCCTGSAVAEKGTGSVASIALRLGKTACSDG